MGKKMWGARVPADKANKYQIILAALDLKNQTCIEECLDQFIDRHWAEAQAALKSK